MTTVTFHMDGERIVGFTVQGHSGYADEGSDIICAAVTSAVRLTECAVNDGQGAGERRFHHHENPRRPERGQ